MGSGLLFILLLGGGILRFGLAQDLSCDSLQPGCCDRNRFCTFWSSRGECNRNSVWMLSNCQVSCGSCKGTQEELDVVPQRPISQSVDPIPVVNENTEPLQESKPARDPLPAGCSVIQPMEVLFTPITSLPQIMTGIGRTGCVTPNVARDCSRNLCFHKKFRSMDGVCNNIDQPLLGAAFTPNPRLLPSAYDDGVNALVGSTTGSRPNPRQVSFSLLGTSQSFSLNASSLLMQWGQFLAHDMTQNALASSCTCNSRGGNCANVPGVPNDPMRFPCSPYTRSVAQCGTGFPGRGRQQMNLNTAFIDGSAIYSSDTSMLRDLRSGFMLRFAGDFRRQMIPVRGQNVLAGDARTGIFVGLHSLHTYFLRLHNTVSNSLSRMNPRWNQDRVFEETRKIVGAVIQVITYQEFLPAFLGSSSRVGSYNGYNPNTNPSILNEFAGAAFRLHGLLERGYNLMDANFRPISHMTFAQGAVQTGPAFQSKSMDFVIRGVIATAARSPQRLSSVVADSSFNLATNSLQRGRDHGFQPYNAYRRHCGLGALNSFDEWTDVSDPAVLARVKQLYPGGVDTLDLYVGGLLEKPQDGAAVGPTFACIINEQFKRVRDGDRFYFENPDAFMPEQIIALRRVTISWVLCSNSESLNSITRTGFITDNGANAVPCSSLQSLDLSPWRE